jgi:hypothetical protein
MDELQTFIDTDEIKNVDIKFVPDLRHDYVSDPENCVPVVVDFVVENVRSQGERYTDKPSLRSKL